MQLQIIDEMQFDFEIDKLTHSLEDASTGRILLTEVLPLNKADLKVISKVGGDSSLWAVHGNCNASIIIDYKTMKKILIFTTMVFLLFGNTEIFAQKGNFKKAKKFHNSAWDRQQKYGENDAEMLNLYTQAIGEYKKCIMVNDKNTGEAYNYLGRILKSAPKSLRDYDESQKYLLKAIEIYEKEGKKDLFKSFCYAEIGTVQYRLGDFSSAFINYQKSAKLDSKYAGEVALMYWLGLGTEQDLYQAMTQYERACINGQDNWANIYALEYHINEYQKGNFDDKATILFLDYLHSKSMDEEKDVWMSLLKQSADLDFPPAQVDYWVFARDCKEYSKGMSYLQKAVDANYVPAIFHIGYAYHMGLGVNTDYQTAAKYYQTAAEQGHPIAQTNLGVFYHNNNLSAPKGLTGYGVAYFWYNEAAEQGYSPAKYNRSLVQNAPKTKAEAIAQTINSIVGVMNTSMDIYNSLNKSKMQAYTPPNNRTQQTQSSTSNNNSSSQSSPSSTTTQSSATQQDKMCPNKLCLRGACTAGIGLRTCNGGYIECGSCSGKGIKNGKECSVCRGKGKTECGVCNGSGKCNICGGTGRVK